MLFILIYVVCIFNQGDDNECIGPEAFLEVCTAYGLVKIVSHLLNIPRLIWSITHINVHLQIDINAFAVNQLRALSDAPAAPGGGGATKLTNARTLRRAGSVFADYLSEDSPMNGGGGCSGAAGKPLKDRSKSTKSISFKDPSGGSGGNSSCELISSISAKSNASSIAAPPLGQHIDDLSDASLNLGSGKQNRRYEGKNNNKKASMKRLPTNDSSDEEEDEDELNFQDINNASQISVQPPGQQQQEAPLSTSPLCIAGIGGVFVADTSRSAKNRSAANSGRVHSSVSKFTPAAPFEPSLSAEGLCGTSSAFQPRKLQQQLPQQQPQQLYMTIDDELEAELMEASRSSALSSNNKSSSSRSGDGD